MDGIKKRKRKINDGIRHSTKAIKKLETKNQSFSTYPNRQYNLDEGKIKNPNRKKYFSKKKKELVGFSGFFKKNIILLKWLLFVIMYIYVLFLIFNKLEKTSIDLVARKENIEEVKDITIYAHPQYGQLAFSVISLKEKRSEKIVAKQEVESEERAHGFITIFNNYSTEPQKLSPETRFESVSGKIFKIGKEGVTIPGKKNGKAGSVNVEVYAEKTGPEYNIDLTDFSIPGFREAGLEEKYQNIYALSLKAFNGGFRGKKLTISDDQKKEHIIKLENELKEILLLRLEKEKTDRVLLVNNSIQIVFKEPIEDTNVITQEAQIFALLIEKKNLEKYLKHIYFSDFQKEDIKILNFDNVYFDYKGKAINFKTISHIPVEMRVKSTFIWDIDTQLLSESLLGLKKENATLILREFDEIQFAKINIFPFWKGNISNDIENIIVSLKDK